jgi:hypothetical protein
MKLQGQEFDGSYSNFNTHQHIQPALGSAIWLTEFTPKRNERLHFVEILLHTLCALGICCTLAGTYPTYSSGILESYHVIALYVAKTSSAVSLLSKKHDFMLGDFKFEYQEAEKYSVSLHNKSILFEIIFIDTAIECGPFSNLNFVDFIWTNLIVLQFKKYAIVAVPLVTPKILYLKHYRASCDGWKTNLLCDCCSDTYKRVLAPVTTNCALHISCKCNVSASTPVSQKYGFIHRISFTVQFRRISVNSRDYIRLLLLCRTLATGVYIQTGSEYISGHTL